jgi:Beta-carotene isomerase D27-like, C-terminal
MLDTWLRMIGCRDEWDFALSLRCKHLLQKCCSLRSPSSCLQAMFARPLPEFSNRMVAVATQLTSQWLMGPSQVATEARPDGTVVSGTTVKVMHKHLELQCLCLQNARPPVLPTLRLMGRWLELSKLISDTAVSFCMQVERCRVLEQSGCASVCVNCCKIPTQVKTLLDSGLGISISIAHCKPTASAHYYCQQH